ncbi:MAG: hypothetical protein GY868_11410, partial [Deltaproteobacteria bacterium]|nr:hypothetical protein [Deltaproteobacteria bacterium]
AGIYKMGAGLGPATAFLYAGPAINVMAIILTSRVLGMELGIARAAGAVLFSIVIGLLMNFFFRHEEAEKNAARMHMPEPETNRPLWQNSICFAVMVFILIFANLGTPEIQTGLWPAICTSKWLITGLFSICFAVILVFWFKITWWKIMVAAALTSFAALLFSSTPLIGFTLGAACLAVITATDTEESQHWCEAAWGFAKQIIPLLFYGVLIAGLLLGRPGHEGLIPPAWINALVGGNSVSANLFASVVGAFMYFATLTEVPILEGLIGSGMGKGPALALLLAGPALSLPNMLVIRSVIGTAKTIVFVCLVVCMAALSGFLYGLLF